MAAAAVRKLRAEEKESDSYKRICRTKRHRLMYAKHNLTGTKHEFENWENVKIYLAA